MPKKGGSAVKDQVDQTKSTLEGIFKIENNRGKEYNEYVKPVNQKDRVSKDIIGWNANASQDDGGQFSSGKKKNV